MAETVLCSVGSEHSSVTHPGGLIRLPLEIPVYPYLLDHRFEQKAVLPAVEAMQILADSVKHYRPDIDCYTIINASFDRFLYIRQGDEQISAFNEIRMVSDQHICAALVTRHRSPRTGVTRSKSHVSIWFVKEYEMMNDSGMMNDECRMMNEKEIHHSSLITHHSSFIIPPDRLYRDLISFGASYHNVCRLLISENGAVAEIFSPIDAAVPGPLGSPFPLDAAFHAACVWGQRYAGIVAFPVGFKTRRIYCPTRAKTHYTARVMPVSISKEVLSFNISIHDQNSVLCESVSDVRMKDVSAGRMKPPEWIV